MINARVYYLLILHKFLQHYYRNVHNQDIFEEVYIGQCTDFMSEKRLTAKNQGSIFIQHNIGKANQIAFCDFIEIDI